MQPRLELATQLAHRAGGLLREAYRRPRQVEHKGAIDLLTQADLDSEQLIVEGIRGAFPEDGILAEEGGELGGAEGHHGGEVQRAGGGGRPGDRTPDPSYRWLIDPLDGTTNFAHGLPFFSVSIALMQGQSVLFGLVYEPQRDELFQAVHGQGAALNGEPLSVSETRELAESLLVTGFPYDIRTNPDNNLDHYRRLALRSHGVRRLGSAALDLAYVAAGRLDGYWELRLNPWDWAAGVLLVQEAGGRVTTIGGAQVTITDDDTLVASNGRIHDQLLRELGIDLDRAQ